MARRLSLLQKLQWLLRRLLQCLLQRRSARRRSCQIRGCREAPSRRRRGICRYAALCSLSSATRNSNLDSALESFGSCSASESRSVRSRVSQQLASASQVALQHMTRESQFVVAKCSFVSARDKKARRRFALAVVAAFACACLLARVFEEVQIRTALALPASSVGSASRRRCFVAWFAALGASASFVAKHNYKQANKRNLHRLALQE